MSTKKTAPIPTIILGIEGRDFKSTTLPRKHEGKHVYKIEYEISSDNKCINYIDSGSKHVVFKNKHGEYVLFHLEGKPINEKIMESVTKALSKKRRTNKNEDLFKDAVLLQYCSLDIDLTECQSVLQSLNEKLRVKCPNLIFKFAHFFDYSEPMARYSEVYHVCIACNFYDTLVLALCKNPEEKCISTIEVKISPTGEILINSKTEEKDEGKKYNKLLRAVLLIIASKLNGATYIKSIAYNPISAWLLIKYSNATIESGNDFEKHLKEKKLTLADITQEIIKEYYGAKNAPIHLIVPINAETSENSRREFQKLVAGESIENEIKCD